MNTNPKNCQNRLPAKGGTLTQKQPRTIKNNLKLRFLTLKNRHHAQTPKTHEAVEAPKTPQIPLNPPGPKGGPLPRKRATTPRPPKRPKLWGHSLYA